MRRIALPAWLCESPGPAIVLQVLAWLACLWIGMSSVLSRIPVPAWGNPLGEAQSAEIDRGTVVGQSFAAPQPGLAGVEVTVHAEPFAGSRQVVVRLTEAQGAVLAAQAMDVGREAATTRVRLDVPPVSDSEGRVFRLSVESDGVPSQGITLAYSPSSGLEAADAEVDGERIQGDLQFQTYYSLSTRQKMELVFAKVAGSQSQPLNKRGPYAAVGLVSAGVLVLFVRQIAHAATAGEEKRP